MNYCQVLFAEQEENGGMMSYGSDLTTRGTNFLQDERLPQSLSPLFS